MCNFILVFTSRKREERAMWLRDFYHCSSGVAAGFWPEKQRWSHEQLLCPFCAWSSGCTRTGGILFRKLYCAYSAAFAML